MTKNEELQIAQKVLGNAIKATLIATELVKKQGAPEDFLEECLKTAEHLVESRTILKGLED